MSDRIVVVGSGINGLVAAADLATRGRAVTVLERGPSPGGAVRTEALTLPGFRHDVAAMNLSSFAGSAFMAAHGDAMRRHGLEFIPVDRPFSQALGGGDHIGVTTSLDETLSTFRSAADRMAWQRLMAEFPARIAAVGALFGTRMQARALAGLGWRTWRKLGTAGTLELMRFLALSPRDWLTETFEDPRLHATLASWGMHVDFAPDVAGGAVFPWLEGMAAQSMGMMIGKGGADTVTRALVAMIGAAGGEIRCDAEVEAIRHAGGRVQGVTLAGGERIEAGVVLANLAPRHLLRMTGGTGDARYDGGLARFRHAPGTMMIHLALSGPVPWTAEALKRFAYVHVGSSIDGAALTYAEAKAGLLPRRPLLVVGQPSVFDPSRAPAGQQALWVQVRMVPGQIRGDAAEQISATDWPGAAEAMADRALALIEAEAPGFTACILGRRVVTPADLEAGNPNLVGGDQVCGSHHLAQNFIFRPVRGFADGHTPLAGLHLVGAATWPGGGTGAGSGFMTARSL